MKKEAWKRMEKKWRGTFIPVIGINDINRIGSIIHRYTTSNLALIPRKVSITTKPGVQTGSIIEEYREDYIIIAIWLHTIDPM